MNEPSPVVIERDQYSLPMPLSVSLHYMAQVRAHGENLRRRIVTPTIVFTFEGPPSKPITIRMSVEVLRRLVAAAAPFLGSHPRLITRS